ncbi:hypothetical protein [Pedobacter insulae]|uniref:Lipoprotein n=1 Tax=Pedobacter insulae TaxID=414048 RepID=A0A1I2TIH7_9SPHI|nr:hypothetical protein [Pedobacter insulae]SFG62306.1 hypothetical protein SAMN04489864_101307 [Pedobacter insulae]
MKTLTLTLAAIIVTLSACGVKKSLTRLQTKTSVQEQTTTSESQLQWSTYTRQSTVNDSTAHLYKITIFPTDSLFHFSIQEGFKGKAKKIEISGLSTQRSYATDTTSMNSITGKDKQIQTTKKATDKATSVVKAVNKHKNYWVWLVMLGVGVGLCYFLRLSLRA